MSGMTSDRLEELRRIAEAATPGPWERDGRIVYALTHYGYRNGIEQRANKVTISVQKGHDCSAEEADAVALHIATFNPRMVFALLDEIERLRRERDAALDVLGREDIGDGAKVEGVRLILKGGDRGWPTRESERVVDNEIERLRKEREVMAEVLKAVHERDRHIHTCDHCECVTCPEGTELSYKAYIAQWIYSKGAI